MIYKNKLIETIQYKVDAVTVSPLSIKDGDDNLKLDNTTGKFYIPGSSVAEHFEITMKITLIITCIMKIICLAAPIPE